MKDPRSLIAAFFSCLLIISCQDVIDLDPPAEPPRLVVDALVRVDPTVGFFRVGVKVSETGSFSGEVRPVILKQITLGPNVLQDTANPGSGVYENYFSAHGLQQGGDNVLQIQYKDQRYLARGYYQYSAPIDDLVQGPGNNFNDHTEVLLTFTDNPDLDNFYLIDFGQDQFMVTDDTFYNGKTHTISFFYDRKIPVGTELEVNIMGIDRSFYNYMSKLIDQSKDEIDLFQTPVSTLRGNIINVTNIDNTDVFDNVYRTDIFALGYFAIAETYRKKIRIE